MVLLVGLPGLTFAQVCKDIEDDAERLACYDARNAPPATVPAAPPVAPAMAPAMVPAIPEEQSVPRATEVQETPAPEPKPEAEPADPAESTIIAEAPADFGREEPVDGPREYITASLVEISTPGASTYLHLDNDQVWKVTGYTNTRFKKGRTITITEGALGSYDLQMDGSKKIFKVKRVR